MQNWLLQIQWLLNYTISTDIYWQLILVYVVWLLVKSRNLFYSLLYLFLLLIGFGVFICFYQMELYTGFLWVAEFSIVLVFLILLIYLNTDGYTHQMSTHIPSRTIIWLVLSSWLGVVLTTGRLDLPSNFLVDEASLWENYYEALSNTTGNDFNGLFLSYYNFNSFEFILFAFLLLLGTFTCVALFKVFFVVKTIPYQRFFTLFDFFKFKTHYNFLRQQNLHTQTSTPAVTRVIKKKIN